MKKLSFILALFFLCGIHSTVSASEISREQVMENALTFWEKANKTHYQIGAHTSWQEVQTHRVAPAQAPDPSRHYSLFKDNYNDSYRYSSYEPNKEHTFAVGAEAFWAKYDEPGVMEQTGSMYGFNGSYSYRPSPSNPLSNPYIDEIIIEGMFATGKFDYEAKGSQTGLKIDKDDLMFEVRGLVSKDHEVGEATVAAFTGLAYRYLNDDDDGSGHVLNGTTFFGYEREANYYYVPLGAVIKVEMNEQWSVRIKGEYDLFFYGKQVSKFSDANGKTPNPSTDAENDQHTGFGLRGSFQVKRKADLINFYVEPFFRYWNIEDSDISEASFNGLIITGLEPNNKTIETGVKLGMEF